MLNQTEIDDLKTLAAATQESISSHIRAAIRDYIVKMRREGWLPPLPEAHRPPQPPSS